MLKKSPLFDAGWYLRRYADVAEAGIDPLMHYIAHGVRERRDPSPHFRTAGYIALHPALDETTMNPLVHFMIEARRVAASPPGRRDRSGRAFGARNRAAPDSESLLADSFRHGRQLECLRAVFDDAHYERHAGLAFGGRDPALLHYLGEGGARRLDPSPLFDTAYYLAGNADAANSPVPPLLYYVTDDSFTAEDPSPFFDSDYYRSQGLGLAKVNPLVHYATTAAQPNAFSPNPLFDNDYYSAVIEAVGGASDGTSSPFAHYMAVGWRARFSASSLHERLLADIGLPSGRRLVRGETRRRMMFLFLEGRTNPELAPAVQRVLIEEHGVECWVVFQHRPPELPRSDNIVCLEDYISDPAARRPSAMCLLARSIAAAKPLGALTDLPAVTRALRSSAVRTHFVVSDAPDKADPVAVEARKWAERAVFVSRTRHAQNRPRPAAKLAVQPREATAADADAVATRALTSAVVRDFGLRRATGRPSQASRRARRILVPCADWSVSGVNSTLDAVGTELMQLGWDVEILFTRDEETVYGGAMDRLNMPNLPFRFLDRATPGLEGMWQALIEELERQAPCIVFTTYDFEANSVIPALSDDIGAVMWIQADDGDYYEQAYRLGRYCNALVSVSHQIAERIGILHPGLTDRTHVIYNSTVPSRDVAEEIQHDRQTLRLIYTGRLVQYQKRILDVVALADALEHRMTPFSISLIGSFASNDIASELFPELARHHLETGRIRLCGRLSRAEIFRELDRHDFFILLSEFEGLPVSLVEAMARGCIPVVAAMASGVPELVADQEDGLIVNGRSYDEWARLLDDVWRDHERLEALAARAAATVRQRLTIEDVAVRFHELLDTVGRELASGRYVRPPALHWGVDRSRTGDVLPSPSVYRPTTIAGLT